MADATYWILCDATGAVAATHTGPGPCVLDLGGPRYQTTTEIYHRVRDAQQEWARRGGRVFLRVTARGVEWGEIVIVPWDELDGPV